MRLNFSNVLVDAKHRLEKLKQDYDDFKIYDLGSFSLNYLTPKRGFDQQCQIVYGPDPRHQLDIFYSQVAKASRPLIVFVHGGAWSHGNKKDYHFVGQALASHGYDVVIINYRLAPDYIFPSSVDDLHLALDYLLQHQQQLNINTEKLVLMGHSAGAFNIMSVLYRQDMPVALADKITAVIGLAGPYHFDYKNDPLCADAFDQELPYPAVMPYYFVYPNQIKHYLLIAEHDQIVAESNAIDFYAQLKYHRNHAEMVIIPHTGHLTMIASLASLFQPFFNTQSEVLRVLEDALSPA
ncbi:MULTISPECIES: alpha/beta hydrolase [unclassified Acinetobacter]|uniref:alpha/beta hydrolase n=1 Tax=unclassified Acinetobacter TaxID=196816 RepID=UPI0029345653|nr:MULTISPECIES: alpha/beta hydrolase [unclassified Acinetobacter]WOE31780.1 alpha/beta hydrolase [Acinetobacter sp. SAAs470]WOE37247.1 alpha/beta hydrolase [Acinetobacter sp. SAAs474]